MYNKPIAVLLNINEYEEHFMRPELMELNNNEVTPMMKKKASVARRLKKSELMNI